jgi:hypothetical protein
MMPRIVPPLSILGLGMIFFSELALHPTQTLYSDHSDLLGQHLPGKHFLVRSWQETGELPLWCPYSFAGMPFIHDPQIAAFYPVHWALLLVPLDRLGAAMSWLIVGHVIVAGWCMYAYARGQELNRFPAVVAAAGYMFAGKTLLHLLGGGHYILVGLAWLPLVLLWLEQAIRQGSLLRATAAGAAYALIVLGTHPQWTMYAGLFIALWTLEPVLTARGQDGKHPASLGGWLGYGAWVLLVAVALSAVQLLPSLEASTLATRAFRGAPPNPVLGEAIRTWGGLIGPSMIVPNWESRTGLGVLWVTVAALAPAWGSRRVQFHAAVAVLLLLHVLSGGVLLRWLPGFSFVRIPARAAVLLALPVALLAANTLQAWFGSQGPEAGVKRRGRVLLLGTVAVALLSAGIEWLLSSRPAIQPPLYWWGLLLTGPAAFWLLGRGPHAAPRLWSLAWSALLLADLWTLGLPLVAVRRQEEILAPSPCVSYLARHPADSGRVLDRDAGDRNGDSPLGFTLPFLLGVETVRGYNPLDVHRYKEYVQFIKDDDPPVLALEGIANFPVRNRALLDLLGVHYVLQPVSSLPEIDNVTVVDTDDSPRAYCFLNGGTRQFPAYAVWENTQAMPRAFVVPSAAPLPARSEVLAALKSTDFRRTVLLEGALPTSGTLTGRGTFRPATIRDYRPNRVTIDVESDAPAYLVLADIWYPGWRCSIDGNPVPVYRANYVFRAVPVPAGRREVCFTFEPNSYLWGKRISLGSVAVLAILVGAGRLVRAVRRR